MTTEQETGHINDTKGVARVEPAQGKQERKTMGVYYLASLYNKEKRKDLQTEFNGPSLMSMRFFLFNRLYIRVKGVRHGSQGDPGVSLETRI